VPNSSIISRFKFIIFLLGNNPDNALSNPQQFTHCKKMVESITPFKQRMATVLLPSPVFDSSWLLVLWFN